MKTFKTIVIDNNKITIYRKFEKKLNLYRYSYDIQTPTGYMGNGGYGLDNSISYSTYESILTSTFQVLNIPKETIRQYKLTEILLKEENDTTQDDTTP